MKDIAVIVVTYNRSSLLQECITSIFQQTYEVNKIYIIDNASSDNTAEICEKFSKDNDRVYYEKLKNNIGGAGGFNYGLKVAYKNGHEYFWIMDDDTIPTPNALNNMINNTKLELIKNWGIICSNVRWIDDSPCLMNVPLLAKDWNRYINDNLISIKQCSFVSMLIRREVVKNCGLPIIEFFIWSDDSEYTSRISRKYDCFLVTNSIVIHKMILNERPNLLTEQDSRIDRHYYDIRNRFYINRSNGRKYLRVYYKYLIKILMKIVISKNSNKMRKLYVLLRGVFDGIRFNPMIEYIDNECNAS